MEERASESVLQEEMFSNPSLFHLCMLLLRYAGPVIITFMVSFSLSLATQIALGHLSSEFLAAGSLGTILFNFTCMSVVVGVLSAQDTLGSQAFGAKQYNEVGIIMQRGFVVVIVMCIPLIVVWSNAKHVLLLMGQDRATAELAAQFVHYQIAAFPFVVVHESMKRFLSCQGLFTPALVCSLPVVVIHPCLLWFLIYKLNLGFIGGPIANVISLALLPLFLVSYILCCKPHSPGTWSGWRVREAMHGWRRFLALGIPGAAMLCLEWWSFEFLTVIAGMKGVVPLAAMNITSQIIALVFMVTLGLSISVQTIVGNNIGAQRPQVAKTATQIALVYGVLFCGSGGLLLLLLGWRIPSLFTSDDAVISAVSEILGLVSLFVLADGLQGIALGVFRGAGLQTFGAVLMFVCCYLFELPLAYVLMIRLDFGLRGILLAMIGTYTAMASVEWVGILCFLKWSKIASHATSKANSKSLESAASLMENIDSSSQNTGSVELSEVRDGRSVKSSMGRGKHKGLASHDVVGREV